MTDQELMTARWTQIRDKNGELMPTILPVAGTEVWHKELQDRYDEALEKQESQERTSTYDAAYEAVASRQELPESGLRRLLDDVFEGRRS